MTAPVFTAHSIRALLVKKLQSQITSGALALFFELRNGTGFRSNERYLDAFAMQTWPSKKWARYAYEIKISRGDFINELKKPDKRAWGMEISNEFWFVCAPGIANPNEIPENCGLLVASKNGKQLRNIIQAKYREVRDFDMIEVAAIARQSCHKDHYSDLRWQYAGKTIGLRELDEIINGERDNSEQREIAEQAKILAAKNLEQIKASINSYAHALRQAGVEPPEWMNIKDGQSCIYGSSSWGADKWVKEYIKPGPAQALIETAKHAANQCSDQLNRLTDCIEKLNNHTRVGQK